MLSCYLGSYLRLAVYNCPSEMIRQDSLDNWSHRIIGLSKNLKLRQLGSWTLTKLVQE